MKSIAITQDKSFEIGMISKIHALFLAFLLAFAASSFAQGGTILKLNVSPMFTGEFGLGLEHKISKRGSIYGDVSFLNKDISEISGKGVGAKAGMRYYFDIKRRYKKGKNKNKLKAFSGHYISGEARYGRLAPHTEVLTTDILTSDLSSTYSKFAVHYGIQKTWKNFFANIEAGPSWGTSDFADISSKGYYTDGFNMDGRFTIGLAF